MLGTNLRCLDNLNGIWGFDTSNSLQTTSLVLFGISPGWGSACVFWVLFLGYFCGFPQARGLFVSFLVFVCVLLLQFFPGRGTACVSFVYGPLYAYVILLLILYWFSLLGHLFFFLVYLLVSFWFLFVFCFCSFSWPGDCLCLFCLWFALCFV